jgi:hypothetical protein
MIEVLAVALGAGNLGLVGIIVWLVYGRIAAADQAADARVAQVDTEGHLERAQFELENVKQALAAVEKRAAALEGIIADEVNASPNPDLARDDVRGRMLRIARQWADADRERSVPAEPDGAVPQASATAASAAPAVSTESGSMP